MSKIQVRVWDNGGKTFDRYTVAIGSKLNGWAIYAMSDNAKSPNGFNQYCGVGLSNMEFCGQEIPVDFLPVEVQNAIEERKIGDIDSYLGELEEINPGSAYPGNYHMKGQE